MQDFAGDAMRGVRGPQADQRLACRSRCSSHRSHGVINIIPRKNRSCRASKRIKSRDLRVDLNDMNPNNELIAAIDSARNTGSTIKTIRRQKNDPNNFYMTTTDNRQVGPVNVTGDAQQLNSKFGEAQSYLSTLRSTNTTGQTQNGNKSNCNSGCNSTSSSNNNSNSKQSKNRPTTTNA